jgi:hypothetical protein
LNKVGFSIICFGLVTMLCAAFFLGDVLSNGLCGNKVVNEYASPDGQLKAVVFTRDCGATTAYSTQVSVMNAGDNIGDRNTGNVLTMDQASLSPEWQGDNVLRLKLPTNTRTYHKASDTWVMHLPLPRRVEILYR